MATVPCPSCGLPRAVDLYEKTLCPLCGHDGSLPLARELDDEPDHDRPWVIAERSSPPAPMAAPPASGSRFIPGVLVGLLLGVAAGVGGAVGWPVVQERLTASASAGDASVEQTPAIEPQAASAVPLPPAPSTTPSKPTLPYPAKQVVELGPPPTPAPLNPFRPSAPRATLVNQLEVYAPLVQPGSTLVARGKVKRLIVPGLERGAVLDCSELEAKEVVVVGRIDGGSRLSVRAPGGRVAFLAKIDGRSKVLVRAPGGKVLFEMPTDGAADGSKIDGGSAVDVTAREVTFHGRIAGAGTKVAATLTAGGALAFAEVDGPARLEYGKADPDDIDPDVVRGRVGPAAVVRKVD